MIQQQNSDVCIACSKKKKKKTSSSVKWHKVISSIFSVLNKSCMNSEIWFCCLESIGNSPDERFLLIRFEWGQVIKVWVMKFLNATIHKSRRCSLIEISTDSQNCYFRSFIVLIHQVLLTNTLFLNLFKR